VSNSIAFVWDNFGPMHVDRVDAVADHFTGRREVIGIEICGESDVYSWVPERGSKFRKITLFTDKQLSTINSIDGAGKIVSACLREKASDIFLCHYDHPAVLIAALCLRVLGRRVYAMGCSKFDDYQRTLWREVAKSLFFLPYKGGLSSGTRARDYMRFLGLPQKSIATEYNTVSIDRIRRLAALEPAPGGTPFEDRHFTIVARFVPKKNISTAIEAYSHYVASVEKPHALHLCGSGPLENELRAQVERLGLSSQIHFRGFLQTTEIARTFGSTLALLLPSREEQFGNVVIEAQALGIPVILSDNCGARDILVRSGVNGFVVEPDSAKGLSFFMQQISKSQQLWSTFAKEALASSAKGDVQQFAAAVQTLTDTTT